MALIDLAEKVGTVLEKRNLPNPPIIRVGLAIDGSHSMRPLYHGGVVQTTVDRLLAVASRLDDDGSLDAWLFDQDSHPLKPATPADYNGYVAANILARYPINGGTALWPVMRDIVKLYFGADQVPQSEPSVGFFARLVSFLGFSDSDEDAHEVASPFAALQTPAFVLVVTDGESGDQDLAAQALRRWSSRHVPIYWQMVCVGHEDFTFLMDMSDELPNVGFCYVPDIGVISDAALYEKILSDDFVRWVAQR